MSKNNMNNLHPKNTIDKLLSKSPLGKNQLYTQDCSPDILFAIPRSPKRTELGIDTPLPFFGYDMWRAYEFAWLDNTNKINLAILELFVPADSEFIVESKSLKLYLYTYRNYKFKSFSIVQQQICKDLSNKTNSNVIIRKIDLLDAAKIGYTDLEGTCIDNYPIAEQNFSDFESLIETDYIVSECLNTNILQSNCPVTTQPDWGSLQINYTGPKINHAKLIEFIGSLRYQNEFHEQCIEKIFITILNHCCSKELVVKGFYTRRGGIDINPFRSTTALNIPAMHLRLLRQ